MRDIAQVAGVVPSHVVYAFGTKEKLYAAVFARRVGELSRARQDRLEEVARAKTLELESLLRAFVTPLLQRSASDEEGWKNYAMLIAQTSNLRWWHRLKEMKGVLQDFDDTGELLVKLIRRAVPGLSTRDALFGFLFFVAAMLNVFAEAGRVERMSKKKHRSADLEAQCEVLIPFCAAGFRGLAAASRR